MPTVQAVPGQRCVGLALLALVLGGIVSTAAGALLVYEPFEYTTGQSLNGQSGGADAIGMTGVWTASSNGTAPYTNNLGFMVLAPSTVPGPFWKGVCTSVPQKGAFAGSPATPGYSGQNGNNPNYMWASRPLNPNIVTNFTLGAPNWMSCVQSQDFNANFNYLGMTFCLGAGVEAGPGTVDNGRGAGIQGGAGVGIGLGFYSASGAVPKYFIAGVWDNLGSDNTTYVEENWVTSTGIQTVLTTGTTAPAPPVWITIAKIVWGDTNNPTTVTVAAFPDGTALSEAAFNQFTSTNLLTQTNSYTINPTTFTNISLGGGRFNVDELRIGTTFNDIIGLVPATYGSYWAPGAAGGGAGTWAAGSNVWATIPNVQGTNSQSPTNTLVFAGTGGTVTVNGTATVGAGLQFSASGYNLVAGGSAPQIVLAGANAAANAITVNSGVTATNSVPLGGTNGLSKAGLGTLILTGAATYSGGTVLNAGTLQITGAASLGGGNVDFEGGTLQYPPGTGTTTLDVSGKVPTVNGGQAVNIDTDGNDVSFGSGIDGAGGLTKLGAGSLTLSSANSYTGRTTVSAGTLNVNSASGVIATLNVPTGGTVNLGAGAVIGALNVTGGTVNLTGAGAQVGALFVSSGTFTNPSAYPLIVTNSANLVGVALTLSGAGFFTLNGVDLLNPTTSAHRLVTVTGGTLSFAVPGLDVAIGNGSPGYPGSAATGHFYGSGVWSLVNGVADTIDDTYGKDNHAFHYMQLPSGDFDIKCDVTGVTNATAGLMVRDNLVSEWASGRGNYIGIYSALGSSVTSVYETSLTAGIRSFWVNSSSVPQGGITPYLEIKRTGNLITTYCSADGTNYNQVQQVDYTFNSTNLWGPTMYLGLDLINTTTGGGSAAFDTVNFMGTAGIANLSTTDFALNGGAQLNLGPVMYVGSVSTNGTALPAGCWAGSALTGATFINPLVFTSTGPGIAVIPPAVPLPALRIAPPNVTITTSDPINTVNVTYPPGGATGGTPPYTISYNPPSGSPFVPGTNTVLCTVTDSSCPFGQTAYGSFAVYLVPPAPVMNPAADANTGYVMTNGTPTLTFSTIANFKYRVLYTTNVATPLSTWLPVLPPTGDPGGWIVATTAYLTISDPNAVDPARYYRVQAAVQ